MLTKEWSGRIQPILRGIKKCFSMVITLIMVSLILLLSPKLSLAGESTTITGTVSLPPGVVAPSGGLAGEVFLYPQTSQYPQYPKGSASYPTSFTIAEGDNSVQYTTTVSLDSTVSGYVVGYLLDNSNNYIGYVGEGYYSSTGTVSMMSATVLNPRTSILDNINLTIFTGNSILGKLSLPDGVFAPTGGIDVSIQVWSSTSQGEFSKYIHIPAGGTSADYFVTMPTKTGSASYKVAYGLNKSYAGLLQSGYYSTLGTSPYYNASSNVAVGTTNVDNVNISILSGKIISGLISLPEGMIAPTDGIDGFVNASTREGYYSSSEFSISSGDSSGNYSVTVPSDTSITDRVSYSFSNNGSMMSGYDGYLPQGYYSSVGTTIDYYAASPVDVSSGNATGINLTIMKGTTISGAISLPQGKIAPAGGIKGEVSVSTPSGNFYSYYKISEGRSTVNYTMTVPPETEETFYKVRYYQYNNNNSQEGYLAEGYYSTTGTTTDYNAASFVDISSGNVAAINLTIIKGTTISGTISLAQGKTAPLNGLYGNVNVWSQNYGSYGASFYILEGSGSASYTATVPISTSVTDYRVNYSLYDYSGAYASNGYYTTTGTTTDYNLASPVDVSAGDITGIDFMIATGKTISGTIALPEGMSAPAEGINGYINIMPENGWNNFTTSFSIPAGSSSASYTVTVSADTSITKYRLGYNLYSNNNNPYLGHGYYTSTGTTTNSNLASLIDVSAGDVTGKTLIILKGNVISGTLELPQGMTAPTGGISGTIQISPQNGGNVYSTQFSIPAESNSTNYAIIADPTIPGYTVSFYLDTSINNSGYLGSGSYSTSGTTTDYSSASPVNVSTGDITGIDLTILKGNTISGTITLPQGVAAPSGGISGNIAIYSPVLGNYYPNFYIPSGSSSASYTVTVPVNASEQGYRVIYSLYNDYGGSYLLNGYYSSTGTTTDSNSASLVDVSLGDVTGIDLAILARNAISGTIALPQGMIAPVGGINGSLIFYDSVNMYSTPFSIPTGNSSTSYSISVNPTITGYRISYSLDNGAIGNGYLGTGYYSSTGTTKDSSLAGLVDVTSGDATGIDLTLLKGTIISGTITLPQGMTAPADGIAGYLQISSQNYSTVYTSDFSISAGNNTASYSVSVDPTITSYRISYTLNNSSGGSGCLQYGYYSSTGTTTNYDSASLVNVSVGDTMGIDLTLLKGTIISGTILLPQGMTAPNDGITGRLLIDLENGSTAYSVGFSIATGNSSVGYSVTVDPTVTSYRISYSLYDSSSGIGYLRYGYHSSTGTTANYSSASLVDVTSGDATGIDLTLLKGTTISGTISLPQGMTAPTDGITGNLEVSLQNGGTQYANFSILAGYNSTTYSITVDPTIISTSYKVRYSLYNSTSGSGYFGYGYYSSTGTTTEEILASLVDVSAGDITGIDLTIIKGNTISGTITLPQGETTTPYGLYGYVSVHSPILGNFYPYFNIPLGSSSTSYSVTVPVNAPGQGYRVNYSLYYGDSGAYLLDGYYSNTGTKADSDASSLVDVSAGDATGINLIILTNGSSTTPQAITLTLDNTILSLTTGQAIQLLTTITPDTVTDKSLTWTIVSQGPVEVITLSNNGLVTALQPGTAVIRATSNADPTQFAECSVTVTSPTPAVDTTVLKSMISVAQIKYDSATEGTEVGQYAVGSKVMLQAAINTAQQVVDNGAATSADISEAVTFLTNAMNIFVAGMVSGNTNTSSATPIVQVGVNPDAGNIAGMYIGFGNILDAAGNPLANAKISGYQIEVDFDPYQLSISDVMNQTTSSSLFFKDIQVSDNVGKVFVDYASGGEIANYDKLIFIPLTLKGSATDQPNITIKYLNVFDLNLHSIYVPTVDNSSNLYKLQRGKIFNGALSPTPSIADAVAGLQYLAKLRKAGNGPDDVNLVNMASITEPLNSNVAKPDIKDVIALLQYTVHLRDGYFMPLSVTPQLSLSQNNINSEYTSPVVISAQGTNTHFTSGITQLNIYNSNNQDVTGNSTLTVQNTTQASITLVQVLEAGNYSVELTTGSERVTTAFTVSAAQQRVASINFLSNELTLSSSTTGSAIGIVSYNVLDQYGTNITNSNLAQSVVFQSGAGSVAAYQGLLQLAPLGGLDLTQLGQVIITGYDPQSGVTTSAALTITSSTGGSTTSSPIGTLSDIQLNNLVNADNKVLLAGASLFSFRGNQEGQ